MLSLAGRYSKPSITATQMLASMVSAPRPTRAEATDVANAIFDGTDALMPLRGTAVGRYPVEAVRTMARIAEQTERAALWRWLQNRTAAPLEGRRGHVSYGVVRRIPTRGWPRSVVPTRSGRDRAAVSAHPSQVPILALSPRPETARGSNLPVASPAATTRKPDDAGGAAGELRRAGQGLQGFANSGDLIGVTAGLAASASAPDLFEVHRVP